ncbi:GntR family transcriptional regulator [Devosia pacifica]|uniref:GntR family transcriptional regulator n=1 Tax=Devosia pacifica TaxID=1335967 RepID=A0A918VPN6_9HYPH|nr:GntR family transcriptional regulator [Devosia pacifica]GHA13874.1 GntR family transcriptional regulator [Devosia pacifica]
MTIRAKPETGSLIQRPPRLGEEVYNAIYAQLMTLQIPPGARISVDSLVRELGVSQTPIREALSRLEAQGLVTKTHLVGYSATNQIDRKRLEQLYELRLLLEPHAAAMAATNMSDEALNDLETLAADMMLHTDENEDPRAAYSRFARKDSAFHDKIADGSGNELIQEALARLYIHVHLFRLFYHTLATATANTEHEEILDALKRRAPEDAEAAMRRHIARSRERFMLAV